MERDDETIRIISRLNRRVWRRYHKVIMITSTIIWNVKQQENVSDRDTNAEMEAEAVQMKLDYEQNPSEESGSLIYIHQKCRVFRRE